jgi:hypothetical protein
MRFTIRSDDAYDRSAAFKIHKAILNTYCEQLKARESQSTDTNKKQTEEQV